MRSPKGAGAGVQGSSSDTARVHQMPVQGKCQKPGVRAWSTGTKGRHRARAKIREGLPLGYQARAQGKSTGGRGVEVLRPSGATGTELERPKCLKRGYWDQARGLVEKGTGAKRQGPEVVERGSWNRAGRPRPTPRAPAERLERRALSRYLASSGRRWCPTARGCSWCPTPAPADLWSLRT